MNILVRAFQSLGEVSIVARGLTVLVGPSHRGKSAMIRAIQGALFNRPGTDFVRKGSRSTLVELTDVPRVQYGQLLSVEWAKGGKTNSYRVDGQDYTRVGAGTPQPLINAGFKDVFIGDADKKKGEYLRPQVGSQFEPLFLLTRTPAFVADVLSVVQRRAVLSRAQDRCSSDVRQQKELHKLRQLDLAAAQEQEKAFDGLDELFARCQPTIEIAKQIAQDDARAAKMQGLLHRRKQLFLLQRDVYYRWKCLNTLHLELGLELEKAERLQAKTTAWRRWQQTRPVVGLTMPAPRTVVPPFEELPRLERLEQAVKKRMAVAPLRTLTLPAPRTSGQMIPSLEHFVAIADKVYQWAGDRVTSLRSMQAFESQLRAQGDELTDLMSQLLQARQEAKVCPTCEQPWA